MDILTLLAFSILTALTSFYSTKFLISFLNKRNIVDIPNSRSNHFTSTPRGGGLAIIFSLLVYIFLTKVFDIKTLFNNHLIFSILILSVISFLDDIKSMPISLRFMAQILAVSISLYTIPNEKLLFNGHIDLIYDRLISLIALVWFMNLYNFMDGIDGISGVESIHILTSLILVSLNINNKIFINDYIIIISAVLGFLYWNWPKAKIFLGDIGSINLGFILGWLLFNVAIEGYIITAFIIPAYYIADTGITIIKRLIQRKKIWHAHSEHFYQIAARNGRSHTNIIITITIANIFLCITSIISINNKISSIVLTLTILCMLLLNLKKSNLREVKVED